MGNPETTVIAISTRRGNPEILQFAWFLSVLIAINCDNISLKAL